LRSRPQVPNALQLLWDLFMRPVKLHQQLQLCGIDIVRSSGWQLWRAGKEARQRRNYVTRMTILLIVTPLIFVGLLFALERIFQFQSWLTDHVSVRQQIVLLIVTTLTSLILGLILDVAYGVIINLTFGIAICLISYIPGSSFQNKLTTQFAGIVLAAALGVASSTFLCLARGRTAKASSVFLAGGLLTTTSFLLTADTLGSNLGLFTPAIVIATFCLASLRFPLYPFEALVEIVLYLIQQTSAVRTIALSPVILHELCYFPLPFLGKHIILTAEFSPELTRSALDACTIAPGQRRIGQEALASLQARELKTIAERRRFGELEDLEGIWLPGVENADPLLLSFRDADRYLKASITSENPYHRLDHYNRALKVFESLKNQIIKDRSVLASNLTAVVEIWSQATRDLKKKAEIEAEGVIPNPFRTEPLSPEQGSEVFRGRDILISQIESLLADANKSWSIALIGARRCGKTSLLKMLPALLPDTLCVFFDLQDNEIDTLESFFSSLKERVFEQAARERRANLQLPELKKGSGLSAGRQWFQALEKAAGEDRILLCIDEFERLEERYSGREKELTELMSLFRATIQHRRRLRILISGVAPFDEFRATWYDTFINVREIRVDHLDRETSIDLLTSPVVGFPKDCISREYANIIFDRTRGQPYLLQFYASLLISRLNDEKRDQVTQDDLRKTEERVLREGRYFFEYIWRESSPETQQILLNLAFRKPVEIGSQTRKWLMRRNLISEKDKLRVPLVATWLRNEKGDSNRSA
jgi:hypothetical protein